MDEKDREKLKKRSMNTVRITKRSYLRNINQSIPMKDNVKDDMKPCLPLLETDFISEEDLSDEEVKSRLEAFFAEQRELFDSVPIPEECISIEEAYRLSMKHLEELYAKKKSSVNA